MNPGFSDLSVQQLVVLELLLRTCSVTRTAEMLGQSQPAVSMTLRRLRRTLGDPLLVRSGMGMVRTSKGQRLQQGLHSLLGELEGLLEAQEGFDPALTNREYTIATADCMQGFFLPRLGRLLISCMPQTRVRMRPLNIEYNFEVALEKGELDLVVGNWPSPPLNLRRKMLFEEQMVCLARRNHPHVKPPALDLRTYLELGHVAPEPYLASHVPGPVDGAVAMLGFKRAIKATIPDFNLAGQMVAATDLVFTCCRQFGDYYARTLDLEMVEAPPEFPPMRFYMLWHDRTQLDPAISWLREQVESVAREFGQPVQR